MWRSDGNTSKKHSEFLNRHTGQVATVLWYMQLYLTISKFNLLSFLNQTLDELPLEAETVEKGYSSITDPTGLPTVHGLPSSFYASGNDYSSPYTASPRKPKGRKSSAHSGEQPSPFYTNLEANGFGQHPSTEAWD